MRHLGLGAALTALFALTGVAAAGDDTMRLDLKKSSKTALTGGADAANLFSHDARAKLSDDDVEDVFFGYSRGYWRGSHGYGYYFPHFWRWRAGYWAGSYGGGWYPFRGYYAGYRWWYPWLRWSANLAYNAPYYSYGYSTPVYSYGDSSVTPVDPGVDYGARDTSGSARQFPAPTRIPMPTRTGTAPDNQLPMPQQSGTAPRSLLPIPSRTGTAPKSLLPMPRSSQTLPKTRVPMPNEPAPKTRPSRPMPPPDDGPTGPPPTYRYDGGPTQRVPMPPPDPNPTSPSPKGGTSGRIVKLTYPAYGDNLRKFDAAPDGTVVVKKTDK
jgi:hypothetical protein